jgi:hypothetical protein
MDTTWQTVRVFIFSTINDMQAERDYLLRVVFPELSEKCAKHNLHLINMDLRCDITEEQAADSKRIRRQGLPISYSQEK